MDIFGALLDLGIGAAVWFFFMNQKTPPEIRVSSLRISVIVIVALTLFLPSMAFMALGQLMVILFFEIPQIEEQLNKDENNG